VRPWPGWHESIDWRRRRLTSARERAKRRTGFALRKIAPALEQISEELAGAVTVAKLNIEESPTTPSKYGVRGIPTMMLFKDGQMASMTVGAMPKAKILEWLGNAGVKTAA
jgi:thioredoxin 1